MNHGIRGVGLFKPCCSFECREQLALGTSSTLSFAASSLAHYYTKMRYMDLASTNCTSQIKVKFYFIYSFLTGGEYRATSRKGFV
jgi:hypothetical protein